MLCLELEWERGLADFTLKTAPLERANLRHLSFLHLRLDPVAQTIQMDEFYTTRAGAALE